MKAGYGHVMEDNRLSREELVRYARHISLAEVGVSGQEKLKSSKVLIVGAGGLGSPLALYLAAAGIGTIGIVDFDTVDLTNLQRQVLYSSADVGRDKVAAAAERILELNQHVRVRTHKGRLTSTNALDILRDYDVIVDGTDNFPTRYLVNDACALLKRPYVYGSILRFEGQVSVFDASRGPCYRCLFREPPPPGLVPSCAEGGVLGVLPGIIGSLQALETLKLILGVGEPLVGRLALFDALRLRWRELKLRKNAACPLCGESPVIHELIDYDAFCGMTPVQEDRSSELTEIEPTELKSRLDAGEKPFILDVREQFEWDIANLGDYGARLMPMGEISSRLSELDRDREIIVHCHAGKRSMMVGQHLRALGFRHVRNLRGGITAWANEVDPDMPVY